jgi:hypothetical protein
VTRSEQLVVERGAPAGQTIVDRPYGCDRSGAPPADPLVGGIDEETLRAVCPGPQAGELAARSSLRAQVARLERELSGIVAEAFPHISPPRTAGEAFVGPRLLSLEEFERLRDGLVGRVQELRGLAAERVEHERRAHELLERMKLEPGRYKFMRLSVNDLGQGGCGVWEVRPRLGLIGMLAGWWQVKLSSGCPLPRGSRSTRGPGQRRSASPRACRADGRSSTLRSSSRTSGSG